MTQSLQTASPARSVVWRSLWMFCLLLAVLYAGLCLRSLYRQDRGPFPGRKTQGQPQSMIRPSAEYELVHLTTSNGDAIVALFGRALDADGQVLPDAAARPTMLFFYGNAMTLADSFNEFRGFRRLGLNVMIPEYPGYGMSSGRASEHSFYACADAAYDHLCHRPDVDPSQIVSAGWSLGAAVATDLAARKPVMCLTTFSAFTSWNGDNHHPIRWLPGSLQPSSRFDNEAKFARLCCPVFIAHGVHDHLVPFAMCKRLAAARGGVVPLEIDCEHNIFEFHSTELMSAVSGFIEGCRKINNRRTLIDHQTPSIAGA